MAGSNDVCDIVIVKGLGVNAFTATTPSRHASGASVASRCARLCPGLLQQYNTSSTLLVFHY